MRKLITRALCALALLCVLSPSALAQSVTIAGITVEGYQYGGTTATLKFYASQTYTASDSSIVGGGTPVGSASGFYRSITCTVSGSTLTCPSVTLPSTTDALDLRDTTWTAVLFDYRGTKRDFFPLSDFALPHTFGATTTWAAVRDYNGAHPRAPAPGYYDADQTNAAINSAFTTENPAKAAASPSPLGRVAVSVTPADAASPVAVGDNDPRVPTQGENDALAGTSGTPSSSNKFVTDSDGRLGALASTWANLCAAVTAVGSTPQVLDITTAFPTGGTCTVPSTLTLHPMKGGSIVLGSGHTITYQADDRTWPAAQIFSGSGTVVLCVPFGQCKIPYALSEWWGAKPDNSTDSAAAINKAWAAHPNVRLLGGVYRVGSPIILPGSFRTLRGAGTWQTYIRNTTAGSDTAQLVGTSSSAYFTDIAVSDLFFDRTLTPTTPGAGSDPSGPMGVRCKWVIHVYLERIGSSNSFSEFYLNQTINVHLTQDFAFRTAGGAGARWYGFYEDCITDSLASISPNASTKFIDCAANAQVGWAGNSTGFYIEGEISDQFIFRPETATVNTGMIIKGIPNDPKGRQVDVHIIGPVFDGNLTSGLVIQDVTPYGQISVVGGSSSPYSTTVGSPVVQLYITNSWGVNVSGFQIVGRPAATVGVALDGGSIHNKVDANIQDCTQPVLISTAGQNTLTGDIVQINKAPTQPAITFYGPTAGRNKVDMGIVAGAGVRFIYSVYFDATAGGGNQVNVTSVDPSAHTTARVREGATNITAVGTTPNLNNIWGVF